MKKILTTLTLAIAAMTTTAQTVPAFPGAEGHGRYTTGGRGGKIVHVTTLEDNGNNSNPTPGSFRAAVKGADKKIVVFDVGGVIALKKDLTIGANTTVLGQTAPAPGITLRYYTIQPSSNCVIRFIRSRRGQEKDVDDGADAIWNRQLTSVMIDHCSFSWSIDEVASFYDNNNFTMQWCTIAESLVHSGHTKGPHGYGGIWGGKLASFHHNLIAHVANRSPRFNGARYNWSGFTSNKLFNQYKWQNAVQAENVDFRNCVIFNCGNGCYGGPGGGQINMVNNYFKSGQISTSVITTSSYSDSGNSGSNSTFYGMNSRYYVNGNRMNNTANYDWSGVKYDSSTPSQNGVYYTKDPNHYYGADSYTKINGVDCLPIKLTEPAPAGEVTTHAAVKAYDKVLDYAGASLNRDDVDERYASETRSGKATYKGTATSYQKEETENGKTVIKTYSCTPQWGRIDLVSDVNGYTEANFGTGSRPADFDADGDGIADAWEQANGGDLTANGYDLDPNKYYTNIEVYANSLVQDIILAGNADATDAVKEYYPAYKKADGTEVAAINGDGQEVTPDDPTQEGDTEVIYFWEEGLTTSNAVTLSDGTTLQITGNTSKTLSAGKTIAVDGRDYTSFKISNGAQNTVTLPSGKTAQSVTFYSYVNKSTSEAADRESYWAEVNGTTYTAETSGGLMKSFTDMSNYQSNPDVSTTFPLGGATSFTFKNAGYQPCLVMKVVFGNGTTTGISELRKVSLTGEAYNLSGQKVGAGYKGIVICNGRKQIQR